MRILIVEQPGVEVAELVARLGAPGHVVRHAPDPGRALEALRAAPPDLLIAALPAPDKGGAWGVSSGVSVAISAQFHNPELVTILLTDSALFSQGELFAMLGSLRCVMRRPAPVDDLVEVAAHFLRNGPVGCAPAANGPDICGKCLLEPQCARAARGRAGGAGLRARAIAGAVDVA